MSGQTSLNPGFEPGPPECEAVVLIFHREARFNFFVLFLVNINEIKKIILAWHTAPRSALRRYQLQRNLLPPSTVKTQAVRPSETLVTI